MWCVCECEVCVISVCVSVLCECAVCECAVCTVLGRVTASRGPLLCHRRAHQPPLTEQLSGPRLGHRSSPSSLPEGAQPPAAGVRSRCSAGVPWAPTELYLAPPNPAILQQFPPGRDLKDFCRQGYKLGALQPCNQDMSGNVAEPSPGAACSCPPPPLDP